MKKQEGFIKILLIVIAIIAVALFVYMRTGNKTETIPSNIAENKTDSSSQASEKDITVDWKTYRNDKYGLEFKYPADWKIQEYKFENKDAVIYIGLDPLETVSQSTFETMDVSIGLISIGFKENNANAIDKKIYESLETSNIGQGISARKSEEKTGENGPNPAYYNRHMITYYLGNKTEYGDYFINDIEIKYVSVLNDKYLKTFDQIISTLKFTK